MILLNGNLVAQNDATISYNNRGTYYGDGLFETIRCFKTAPIFLESHYFRLMSSMRMLRMEIPDNFTLEFFKEQIDLLHNQQSSSLDHSRIRITVWRKQGGYYTPTDNNVQWSMELSTLDQVFTDSTNYEVELFKDFYVQASLLTNLKTTTKTVNILAGIFAEENDYQDMLLLNDNKMVAECISGNLFLRQGNIIKTPPLSDGCLNGIMREQVLTQIKRMMSYEFKEESITPFELQRADELFFTNSIQGIKSITKYRKKSYTQEAAQELREYFNEKLLC
ncbi:aminotransferase class IV [Nonlabens ponticola]|uniref:branched-chain-amino-acid transaminase n=1 Tax=Nonlabens ponticola TaxID=2496866 RepID=A0A3S9MZ45_9FLAO|nr:aminotransferase class IV [Nonlabens ponticola]AZQ44450.1 aminotransferase class IV [Nonlabens ponticola]